MLRKAFNTAKELATDQGFDFAIGNIVLFAALSNPVALGICVAAATTIAAVKVAQDYDVIGEDHWLADPRRPLQIAGASMLGVAGAALNDGAAVAAFTSASFAGVDFALANSLHADNENEENKGVVRSLVTGPDMYVTTGLTGAAYMATEETPEITAAMALPIVAGTAVTLWNAAKNNHETTGKPKLLYATACTAAGLAGLALGNIAPAVANLLFAAVYTKSEADLTEKRPDVKDTGVNGFRQIGRDMKGGIRRALRLAA